MLLLAVYSLAGCAAFPICGGTARAHCRCLHRSAAVIMRERLEVNVSSSTVSTISEWLKQDAVVAERTQALEDERGPIVQGGLAAKLSPKVADSLLAATGAGASVGCLVAAADATDLALWVPPLAASTVLVWAGVRPPPLRVVALGVAGATSLAVAMSQLGLASRTLPALAVAGSLLWFKLGGSFYPPAAALSALFLDSAQLRDLGWEYVLCPCLASNLALWLAATLAVAPRRAVREALVRARWGADLPPEAVRLLADVYGDRALSETELCFVVAELAARVAADDGGCVLPDGEGDGWDAAAQEARLVRLVGEANRRAERFEAARDPTATPVVLPAEEPM